MNKKLSRFLLTIFMLGFTVTLHEFGHAVVAALFGVPIEKVYLGIKLPPYFTFSLNGIPMTVSPWFVWGGVLLNESTREMLPAWQKLMVLFAGPGINIVFATCLQATYEGNNNIKNSRIPDGTYGPIAIFGLASRFMEENGILLGTLVFMSQLNIGVALFNLIPLYPLDGEGILEITITALLGPINEYIVIVARLVMLLLLLRMLLFSKN